MKATDDNLKFCGTQVARLQGTRFFDTLTTAAINELRSALTAAAIGQAQAELIVTVWLSEHSEYPTAADLYAVARQMNKASDDVASSLPATCERCAEFGGYVLVDFILSRGVFAGEKRSGLALCSCERGRALAEGALRSKSEDPSRRPTGQDFTSVASLIQAETSGRVS